MKKITTIILTISALMIGTTNSSAQAVEEGNILIDVYYGFPNLYTTVFKSLYAQGETDVTVSGLGPVGLRGEYMVADKIGVGLDLGFNNTKIVDPYVGSDGKNYEAIYSTRKIGAIVTFNYHFLDNDKVDAYTVIGMGYGSRSFTDESNEPGYNSGVSVKSPIPVASKIGVGMRYFFTDNIGLNLALGFGQGGIVNAGLSIKL